MAPHGSRRATKSATKVARATRPAAAFAEGHGAAGKAEAQPRHRPALLAPGRGAAALAAHSPGHAGSSAAHSPRTARARRAAGPAPRRRAGLGRCEGRAARAARLGGRAGAGSRACGRWRPRRGERRRRRQQQGEEPGSFLPSFSLSALPAPFRWAREPAVRGCPGPPRAVLAGIRLRCG